MGIREEMVKLTSLKRFTRFEKIFAQQKNGKGRGMITLFNYPNWWTKLFSWNSSKFRLSAVNANFQGVKKHSENTLFIQRDHIRILVIFFKYVIFHGGSNDEQEPEPATKTYDGAKNSKPCRTFVVYLLVHPFVLTRTGRT